MKNILVTLAVACFASSAFAGAPRVTTPGDVYQQDWMRKAVQNAKVELISQGETKISLFPTKDKSGLALFPTKDKPTIALFPTKDRPVIALFPTKDKPATTLFPSGDGRHIASL